jgi:hypothetical protein
MEASVTGARDDDLEIFKPGHAIWEVVRDVEVPAEVDPIPPGARVAVVLRVTALDQSELML